MSGEMAKSVPSLVDVAQNYIRERIASGEFPPGYRLKERDLAEETGISRIPIREAMRALATEGFVTIVPRRGAIVTELRPGMLDEIFEVREVLEIQECVLAAQKATKEQTAALFENVAEARDAVEQEDFERFNAANVHFHGLLVEAAHNEVLATMLRPLNNRLNWILRQNSEPSTLVEEHQAIVEAIAARDVEAVRDLAKIHVETSKRLALAVLFPDGIDETDTPAPKGRAKPPALVEE